MRAGRSAGAGLALLFAAGLAGCGGGGGDDPAPVPTTVAEPAGVVVRVVNGDLGTPVAGVTVAPVGPAGRTGERLVTGADGAMTVPDGTMQVRARRTGWSAGAADVTGRRATVRIYDQRLQSPEYGVGPARTRFNPHVRAPVAGSVRRAWRFDGKRLLEFPPAVKDGVLVVGNNAGRVFGIDARTGRQLWTQKRRSFIASSPAIGGRRAYITSMDGLFTAYRLTTGTRLWEYSNGGSPIESSPLIVDDTAYFGAWNGELTALDLRNGRPRWTYRAGADIKGSAAKAGPNIVFGDYSGVLTAVNARTGRRAWSTDVGARLYGGPGVSGNRIVIGDVGGQVVCVDARTGAVLWRHATGAYVYASPAIARNTVFIGDYDGDFEALDLGTGAVRWRFAVGGRISGSATVVGDTVYTAVLAAPGQAKRTWGLATANGRVRFRADDGRYSPAVAAGRTVYVIGVRHIDAYRAPAR